jgi:hypothetical protein
MAYSKTCKYCNLVKIEWDDKEGKYFEVDSKQQHTKERCQEAQNKGGIIHPQRGPLTAEANRRSEQSMYEYHQAETQKQADIKAAQLQRKKEHDELIKNMQWLTRTIAHLNETQGGGAAKEILESMGFEDYRNDQREGLE